MIINELRFQDQFFRHSQIEQNDFVRYNVLMLKLIMLVLFIFAFFGCVCSENRTDVENLVSVLFNGYDTSIRPIYGQQMNITVGFYLFSIKDFDEISGTLTSVGGPIYFWNDPRLTWDPSEYGYLYTLPMNSSKVWHPSIYLINPADIMEPIGHESFVVRLSYNGDIWRYVGSILKTSCDVDMTYFPFDTQVCMIEMMAFSYSPSEIYLTIMYSELDLTYYKENSQWAVVKSELKEHQLKSEPGMVAVVMSLKRKPEYFAINILAPIFMLCFLNPLVFFLPTDSGERISYTITIFLSLAVFMTLISDSMPKSSDPMPRLSFILLTAMAYSTILCVLSIFIMRIYYRDKSKPIPEWVHTLLYVLKFRCINCCCKKTKIYQSNDMAQADNSKHDMTVYGKPKPKPGFVVEEDDTVEERDEENDLERRCRDL